MNSTFIPLTAYLVSGIGLGIIVGKALSGNSEEARGWAVVTVILWPAVLALLALGAIGFVISRLLDKLGIKNA